MAEKVEMFAAGSDGIVRPLSGDDRDVVDRYVALRRSGVKPDQTRRQTQSDPGEPAFSVGVTGGQRRRSVSRAPYAGQGELTQTHLGMSPTAIVAQVAMAEMLAQRGVPFDYPQDLLDAPEQRTWGDYSDDDDPYDYDRPVTGKVVPDRKGIFDRLTKRQRTIGAVVAVVAVAGVVGLAVKNREAPAVATTTAGESAGSIVPEALAGSPNYTPGPLAPVTVITFDGKFNGSSMWDFKDDGKYEPKNAIGVADPNDISFDFTVTPEVALAVSAGFDPKSKTNAIRDITKEGQPIRAIEIDMSLLKLTPTVNPESIKDTTAIPFFSLTQEQQTATLSKALDLLDVAVAKVNPIYEENKNHLEYQGIAYIVQYILNNPEKKKQVLEATKATITKELGLGDPSQYVVTFIGQDKFGAAKPAADEFIKVNKISNEFARPVVTKEDQPIITADVKQAKPA